MSENKDQEYFAEGVAEEIIDRLSKVSELQVLARTSSFYFRGKATKIPDIARELNVAHVLEGSLRKSGNHLRITAQLVRADSGYHEWSETFDRDLDDVFKVEDEIAGAVVRALKVSLLEGTATRPNPTSSTEAYTLYLQARSIALRAGQVDYEAAIDYLQRALKLDPPFRPPPGRSSPMIESMISSGTPQHPTKRFVPRCKTRLNGRSSSIRICRTATSRWLNSCSTSTGAGSRGARIQSCSYARPWQCRCIEARVISSLCARST